MNIRHLFLLFAAICGGIFMILLFQTPIRDMKTDMVAVNRITRQLEETWPSSLPEDFSHFDYPFSLIDAQGKLLFVSSPQASLTLPAAIQEQDVILDFQARDGTEGRLLIHTGILTRVKNAENHLYRLMAFFTLFWLAVGLLYGAYLNWKLLAPFWRLQAFAGHIARGNLDVPLTMDRNHLFGSFTESFDLMRDQLNEAKKAEAMAKQSKQELIASLSHDIKTPVTAIKLISELLKVTAPEEFQGKIDTIYKKAGQIDCLVTDLFRSAMEELQQLSINMAEVESTLLNSFFKNADYYGLITCAPIPGCILKTDPLRLEQVIDNVINNSYKYARTPIQITARSDGDFLQLTISDFGPGVGEEELPHLFDRCFRGQAAIRGGQDGSGIGLYVSRTLMEQMNGEMICGNKPDGFFVSLLIPLV